MIDDRNKSLIDMFKPPEGYTGVVMALTAMSADKNSLQEISRAFTNRQFHNGFIFGHLFLDKRFDCIANEGRVFEGIYQYQSKVDSLNNLLHAKIFLLGFAPSFFDSPTLFRVIVYTGNLTTASINHQLELIWTFDISNNESDLEKRSDLYNVCSYFEKILENHNSFSFHKHITLENFLALAKKTSGVPKKNATNHFISSFDGPIVDHIKKYIQGRKGLNKIICGSGFFEKDDKKKDAPNTIKDISNLVANFDSGKIVLNPSCAGAIASWELPEDEGWLIHTPKDQNLKESNGKTSRFLHAKFILFYNKIEGRGSKATCNRGVLYIGSGNISRRGLVKNLKNDGNIESGILIDVNNLSDVYSKLFVGEAYDGKIESGEGDQDEDFLNKSRIPFCPVLALKLGEHDTKIIWCEDGLQSNTIIEIEGKKYKHPDDKIPSKAFKKSQDIIYEGESFNIPVISLNGLVNERDYKLDSFQDALDMLENFSKQTLDDETIPPEDDEDILLKEKINSEKVDRESGVVRNYPLHTSAELIEKIAYINKSFENNQLQIPEWLFFLDNYFLNLFKPSDVQAWKDLGFNFLSVLKHESFSIPCGEHSAAYNIIIDKIILHWELYGLEEF